jgi:hypothetical protein
MAQRQTRRTVLRVLPVVGLGLFSGCSSIVDSLSGPPPDLVVFNRTGGSITTSITVREQGSDDSVLSKQTDIGSDQAAEYADALPVSGDYTMQIKTNGGLSGTHYWTIASEDQSMQVRVRNDSINFDTVSP